MSGTTPGVNLRRDLAAARRAAHLEFACARIRARPPEEQPSERVLSHLQIGFGNQGHAADQQYLREAIRWAQVCEGPILECGSGLTTLALALYGARRGVDVWALEHDQCWLQRTQRGLRHGRAQARVHLRMSPLRSFDFVDWYDAPLEEMPPHFSLVVCDGPPGHTRGGRAGLLDVVGDRIRGAVILLDDTNRESEKQLLEQLSAHGYDWKAYGDQGHYAVAVPKGSKCPPSM